jgi:hypothetical protein
MAEYIVEPHSLPLPPGGGPAFHVFYALKPKHFADSPVRRAGRMADELSGERRVSR